MFKVLIPIAAVNLLTMSDLITVKTGVLRSPEQDEIRLRLELIPEMSAKETINWLMIKYPGEHNRGQIRTLQRRFAEWRQEQLGQESRLRALMVDKPSQTEAIEVKNLVGYVQ